MYAINLSDEQLSNMKRVLFGNQKQANVINDSVALYITRNALELGALEATSLYSEQTIVSSLSSYLEGLTIDSYSSNVNDDFILMLCGKQSLANLSSIGPKYCSVEQPNPESPKHNFRILMLGETPDLDTSADVETPHIERPKVDMKTVYNEQDDFMTRATKIKDAILPLVPDAVKTEIPNNEWAQALCCSEYFYNYHRDDVRTTPSTADIPTVVKAFKSGKDLGTISREFNLTMEEVKLILKNSGFSVY